MLCLQHATTSGNLSPWELSGTAPRRQSRAPIPPQSIGDHFSSERALFCNTDCPAEETAQVLSVEANLTLPQVPPLPLKPGAEGLGS